MIEDENVKDFERYLLLLHSRTDFIRIINDTISYPGVGTLLMVICIVHRNIDMMQLLLNYGANVNIINPNTGYSALHIAVVLRVDDDNIIANTYRSTMKIIPLLLRYGANVHMK